MPKKSRSDDKHKKTLQRIQDIEKLPEEERKVIYKVLDSLLRDAKTKQAYA